MKNGNGKSRLIIVVSVLVFLVLIFSASYAILGAQYAYNNSNVSVSIGNRPIFTATPSGTVTLANIPYIAETSNSAYEIANNSATLNIALSTGYSTSTNCTYNVVWKWNTTSDNNNKYTKTSGAVKEYTISGSSSDGQSFSETQLNNYSSQTNLYTGSITSTGPMVTQTWTFNVKFYKTTAIQTSHRGSSYNGQVVINNVTCKNAS